MLEFLLSYSTLVIASVVLMGLLYILLAKRKLLSSRQRTIAFIGLGIILLYLVFIIILVIAFGGGSHNPTPVF